jgi:hypothetical protein
MKLKFIKSNSEKMGNCEDEKTINKKLYLKLVNQNWSSINSHLKLAMYTLKYLMNIIISQQANCPS